VLGAALASAFAAVPTAAQTTDTPAGPDVAGAHAAPAPRAGDEPRHVVDDEAPNGTTVEFVSEETGLTILARSAAPGGLEPSPPRDGDFSLVCVAPCRAQLGGGSHQFGVIRGDGGAVLAGALAYEVQAPTSFRAQVISRADTRRHGWYVLSGLGGAGIVSSSTALAISCGEDRDCAKWTSLALWGGLGALSLGVLIGLPMVLREDQLEITVLPLAPASETSSQFPGSSSAWLPALAGFTVSGAL